MHRIQTTLERKANPLVPASAGTPLSKTSRARQRQSAQQLIAINDLFHDIAMHSRRMDTRERLRMLHLSQEKSRSISNVHILGAVASLAQPIFAMAFTQGFSSLSALVIPMKYNFNATMSVTWNLKLGVFLVNYIQKAISAGFDKSCGKIIDGIQSRYLNFYQFSQREYDIWQQAAQERNVKVQEDLRSLHQKLEQALQAENSIVLRSFS